MGACRALRGGRRTNAATALLAADLAVSACCCGLPVSAEAWRLAGPAWVPCGAMWGFVGGAVVEAASCKCHPMWCARTIPTCPPGAAHRPQGILEEVRLIKWPTPKSAVLNTLLVIGIVAGTSGMLFAVNTLLAEVARAVYGS